MVAAVSRVRSGIFMPRTRMPKPERISGWAMGAAGIFAEIAAHPGDAFAADNVICIDEFIERGNGGNVSADDDVGFGREFAHEAAHLADFGEVGDDAGDADDVVGGSVSSRSKRSRVGKSSRVLGAEMLR